MRHLIDPLDLTREETDALLDLACRIRQDPAAYRGRGPAQTAGYPFLRALHPHPPVL